ncbi:MAG: YicC/YloC family endoribonuclease [Candidatus Omnitrophota bacterium]
MIRSMTGFGSGKARSKYGMLTVEIRTVNHKFLEITCKFPNSLVIFEDRVKALLKKSIKRGKVYLNTVYEGVSPHSESLYVDERLAKNYYRRLCELKKMFSLDEKIGLKEIISFPGVLNYRESEKEVSRLWPHVEEAVKLAQDRLIRDREREGRHLSRDFNTRLSRIRKHVARIKEKSHLNVKKYKERLEKRIKEISGISPNSNDRLVMEVALYAKNSDVSEEITRLKSHLLNFQNIVTKGGESGKKLDFVAQEMHREANTVGSKSSDYSVSKSTIEIKSEIEKIREQVKNIE